MDRIANKLISETSPYLLQHAYNPVDWHPWNDETLEKAKQEGRMLLISIGYSACHWCHVMEHESFENQQVAAVMNEHFICIKVDREERPDVDRIYMDAVQMLSGQGGWPLNCFALPDGKPVWGGTYFRREQWLGILENIAQLYNTRKEELVKQAESITDGIKREPLISLTEEEKQDDLRKGLGKMVEKLEKGLDFEWGGSIGAPKFPMPGNLEFLLRYAHTAGNRRLLEYVSRTLTKMADGGIYDQIGGGFARYSTDEQWKVPHFEKMLYDNAQLISLYSHAYQLTGDERFKEVVFQSISFIRQELLSDGGGFYAALDADSEGEEGKYYVWKEEEIDRILKGDASLIKSYWGIEPQGNWEKGINILIRSSDDESFAQDSGMETGEWKQFLENAKASLLLARSKRTPPGLDNKIILSWNAMMIRALTDAYNVFGEEDFLNLAKTNCTFILCEMMGPESKLWHIFTEKGAKINGFLEDYAWMIDALIALYESTFEFIYLDLAEQLTNYTLKHFKDPAAPYFYFTSAIDRQPVARKYELIDNVIPASNSVMACNLFRLGQIFDKQVYIEQAREMLAGIHPKMLQHASSFSNWARLMINFTGAFFTVAITGPDAAEKRKQFNKLYLPGKVLLGSETEIDFPHLAQRFMGELTMIFVCTGNSCQRPVSRVEEALAFFRKD